MPRIRIVMLVLFLVVVGCGEKIEPLKSLQKGTPNTITLSSGDVIYDISGEWDAIHRGSITGKTPIILENKQKGDKFSCILLTQAVNYDKGTEILKGELEKSGFRSLQYYTSTGWVPAVGKISEGCNEISINVEYDLGPSGKTKASIILSRK